MKGLTLEKIRKAKKILDEAEVPYDSMIWTPYGIVKLKGKRNGGELHGWCLRDIPDEDGTILGQLAYGWRNGMQTWRTSKVVEVHETGGGHKILETRNTFYTLVGDEATEEQRTALYNVVF